MFFIIVFFFLLFSYNQNWPMPEMTCFPEIECCYYFTRIMIFFFSQIFLTFYSLWFYHLKIYVDKNSRVVGRWLLWAKVKRLKVVLDFSGNNSPPHSRQQLLCPRPGVSWQSDSKLFSRVLQDLHLTRSLCNDLDWALFTVYHSLLGRRDYLWNSKEEQTAC